MTGDDPLVELGRFLTGAEARQLADSMAAGTTLTQALSVVPANRRDGARARLAAAGLGVLARDETVRVLRALQGAHAHPSRVSPVWTVPHGLSRLGDLTGSIYRLVDRAVTSVTCATFNLRETSGLWRALVSASRRTDVDVRLYLDTAVATGSQLDSRAVADRLPGATVLRTLPPGAGRTYVRTHAKFLVLDHRWVVVTSANLSLSAERHNVELGLVVEDRTAAEQIETQMRLLEGPVYEVVRR